MTIEELAREAWRLYDGQRGSGILVVPSIPILYFGDMESYQRSKVKVITVGLNPSRMEFPPGNPSQRLPPGRWIGMQGPAPEPDGDIQAYLSALNSYFQNDPYRRWFDGGYGPILEGMGASYYGDPDDTALHTDICSPLATDPTWSRLTPAQQNDLVREGAPLWNRLVEFLQPDIVLISVRKAYLSLIEFGFISRWQLVYTVERKNPYVVYGAWLRLASGKAVLFVFGKAAEGPFGTLSRQDKLKLGRFLREYWESSSLG